LIAKIAGDWKMTKKRSAPVGSDKNHFAMTPLATAVMFALHPTAPALAQDTDESDEFGIEEIVVTATKRAVNIQDVPQSIIAFSTAEIERRGMLDMADIASNLPSITLSSSRAGRNELVYRGISNGGSWRLESQVAMYLDEMPMTMSTTQLDPRMVDIERVESLPGPQGTLFGSASQAGTLRVVTNKPRFDAFSGEMAAEIKSTQGGEESYDINGHINIPVSDNFALRVVGYTLKEGGYIDNVYSTAPHVACAPGAGCDHDFSQYAIGPFNPVDNQGHLTGRSMDNAGLEEDDFNDYEMTGGRISALWNINEDWSALVTVMHQDSETTGVWFSDTAIGDYKVARFSDEWRKDTWTSYAFTVTGDLGFAELTNSFGYADREQSYQFDNTHYDAYHTRLKGQYGSAWKNWYDTYWGYPTYAYNYYDKYDTDYNGGIYRSLQESERITNEIRLTSTTDSRFQWMVGAFFEDFEDGWDDRGDITGLNTTKHWRYTQWRSCDLEAQGFPVQCPAVDPDPTWYNDSYARDVSQIAVFGQVDYDLTDDIRLTAGLRWFEYDRYVVNDRQWPPGLPVEAILLDGEGASIEDGKESDTSVKLGISWSLSDDQMVYALFSQGFRTGGRNNPKAVRVNFVPEFYEPDKLNNYEIGLKSDWLNNQLQLNATVFYMTWDDIQLSLGSDQGGLWWLRGQANGGGGENTGAELDVIWQATDKLRLTANAYVGDPVYTADYITLEGVLEVSDGTSMPDSAREKVTLAADYMIPNVFGGEMWLRYDWFYQSEMYSALWRADEANPASPNYVPGSTYDVESFSKSNFQVGYERETWSARIMVRNLFDDRANTFTGSGASEYAEYWGHTGFGETHNLSRPRTISFKFTKTFD
jgi:iron complex outermembrane receptor protein